MHVQQVNNGLHISTPLAIHKSMIPKVLLNEVNINEGHYIMKSWKGVEQETDTGSTGNRQPCKKEKRSHMVSKIMIVVPLFGVGLLDTIRVCKHILFLALPSFLRFLV